ncbi:hypothetical protein P4S72_21500 [Vibrio sp. PP-XX7]
MTLIADNKIHERADSQLMTSVLIGVGSLIVAILILLITLDKLVIKPVGGAPSEIADLMEHMSNGDLTQHLNQTGRETGIYLSLVNLSPPTEFFD